MKIRKMYSVNVFNNGIGNNLGDYVVRFKADGKMTIRISVVELLMLIPGNELLLMNGKVKIAMIDLWHVRIEDDESIVYSGFHEMRESVRAYMKKKKGLLDQLEEINRKLAVVEFKEYMSMKEGERKGFSMYFKERFPEKSKIRFDYNIGYMFGAYQREFDKDEVPKQEYTYYETEFRTRDRGYGDTYVYPIQVRHVRKEATYLAKAAICTLFELEVVA